MNFKIILTYLPFLFVTTQVTAQIKGKVLDLNTNQAIDGVHLISGESTAVSNAKGEFQIHLNTDGYTIVSHLGYVTDTITNSALTKKSTIYLQAKNLELDQITIKGNLKNYNLKQIPASYGFIGTKQLNESKNLSYVELLNQVPGVFAHSGTYSTNRITIRGIGSRTPYSTNRIKAYYNNIPLTNGDGSTEVEDIDALHISEINVFKGSKSALYGSGLGGVLLMNKNLATNNGYSGQLHMASFNTYSAKAEIKYKKNKFSTLAGYSWSNSDGWRQNSNYKRQSVNFMSDYKLKQTHFSLTVLAIDTYAEIPSSLNENTFSNAPDSAASNWLNVNGHEDYTKLISGLNIDHKFTENFSNTTTLFFKYYLGYESRPFNILNYESTNAGVRNISTLKTNHLTTFAGFELMFDNYSWQIYETNNGDKGILTNHFSESRIPLSVFLNTQYQFANSAVIEAGVSLNALNYKLIDEFDNTENLSGDYKYKPVLSPFIGINVPLNHQLNLYSSASHGFSAPSVEETLYPDGSINPELKPETGINSELGFRYMNIRLYADACIYSLWTNNLLVTKRESEDIFYGINAGKTWHRGFELNTKIGLFDNKKLITSDLHLNYNFIQANFTDFTDDGDIYDDNSLPGIPNQHLHISIKNSYKKLFYVTPQLQFTGRQFLNDSNNDSYPSYYLLNVTAGINLKWFNIDFKIKNILDKSYASMLLINAPSFGGRLPRYYYPGMPRNYVLALQFSL